MSPLPVDERGLSPGQILENIAAREREMRIGDQAETMKFALEESVIQTMEKNTRLYPVKEASNPKIEEKGRTSRDREGGNMEEALGPGRETVG